MTGASAQRLVEAARAKQAVRERVWALLERERMARFPAPPAGSPTSPEPRRPPPRRAASITGSAHAGRRIGVAELQPVDLVVCGSVAVNRQGARVGKGGGFSDLEFALLAEAGLIGRDTVVATTVHPLQVLEEALPKTDHEFRLDLIVAGEEVITCRRTRRPPGILWEHFDPAKVAAIPPGRPSTPARNEQAVILRWAMVELARVRR